MLGYIRPNILLERHLISLAGTVSVSRLLFISCCCAKLTDVSECYLALGDFCFVPFAVFFAQIFFAYFVCNILHLAIKQYYFMSQCIIIQW